MAKPLAVTLAPMSPEAFALYREGAIAGYAADNVAAGRWPEADARALSEADFARSLPLGPATPDNHLFEIHAGGAQVGILWFAALERDGLPTAFVYDLEIAPDHRRQGYAEAAMAALEPRVRALGLTRIALHVFGRNDAAQALYAKGGFHVTGINMLKTLTHLGSLALVALSLAACGPSASTPAQTPTPTAAASTPAQTPTPTAAASTPTAAQSPSPTVVGPTPTLAPSPSPTEATPASTATATATPAQPETFASVLDVTTTPASGGYTFYVTVSSPDTGCERYADWWEVLSPEGALLYRRILDHSHVDDQPFTRSGGPVAIEGATEVIVRAHMSTTGYGGAAVSGTPRRGFEAAAVAADFHPELGAAEPQPDGCAF